LEACKILKEEKGVKFRCWIIGDGALRKELERMAEQLEIGDPNYYRRAHIFVLASLWEGIPVSLMEAMASGLAVVATRVTGIPELVEDGVSGLLVPPQDSKALAEAIYKLLRDKELREKMGKAARQKVVEEFDNRKTAKLMAQLLLEYGGRR